VTAQRAVVDGGGRFEGVVRLALRTEALDRMVHEEAERARPHRLFLADEQGRLVTRPEPGDALVEQADQYGSLRVEARTLPPEIEEARRQPERALELYEFEACPYCRKVREVLKASPRAVAPRGQALPGSRRAAIGE